MIEAGCLRAESSDCRENILIGASEHDKEEDVKMQ